MSEILRYIIEGENKFIELKREFTPSLLKTICAFANFHDGRIIIGVSDSKEIIGVSNIYQIRLNIENAINDNISPRPFYEMTSINVENKDLLLICVYKGEYTPYYLKNKAYMRQDTSTIEVDRYYLNKLILEGQNYEFEAQESKFQERLAFSYLEGKLRNQKNISSLSSDVLRSLELIKGDKYTNAAALLSDSNPIENSGFVIIKYSKDKMNIDDKLDLTGLSILMQFERSIEFFKKHMQVSERIEGPYRQTIEEVPIVAYREAISNAIVHRDYMHPGSIKVEIFSDRIEITSPGGLPSNISENEYIDGRISIVRNRIITDIFLRLNIIEKLATGVRRIKEHYINNPNKPVFDVKQNSIRIILPRDTRLLHNQSERINGEVNESQISLYGKELTEKEREIINYILKNSEITRHEAENLLLIKKTQTVKILNSLVEKNIITKISKGKNIKYLLKRKQ